MSTPDSAQVALLAAALRRDAADLSLYAGFLFSTFSTALPADMVEVARERSMRDRLAGREGEVVELRIRHDDRVWRLRREGVGRPPVATVVHEVNGIVLSRDTLALDVWADQVAQAVVVRANQDSRSAEALAKALEPRAFD